MDPCLRKEIHLEISGVRREKLEAPFREMVQNILETPVTLVQSPSATVEGGRIEEHFAYVDQNLSVLHQDFVEQHEHLSGDFPVVTDVSHNESYLHQNLVGFADTHQTPEVHGGD